MRSHRLRAALLPLLVAPALLAGCGSGDSDTSASDSGSASQPAADDSASEDAEASADADAEKKETFCTEVPALLSDITDDLQGFQNDPQQAPALLAEAVERISAVEPPSDAAPQWQRLVTAWTGMRDLLNEADLTNPAANADLAPRLQELQTELVDSGTAVDEYGKANC
ncbi:hypothetical protein [Modestobacter versicolor]|uniref:Peptidase M75 n=1 Tax=Modestobacter versicolor TaxID=429133 RepID=A0A323V3H3_9ACTN|nr:hypothetical protein [Modestobacter versicolor]MBB3676923.1 hypothetical protein [Modestobacter versicolor]PZA19357.1 hypothetical protein DMO24_21175 [Modestobacter versicolor]